MTSAGQFGPRQHLYRAGPLRRRALATAIATLGGFVASVGTAVAVAPAAQAAPLVPMNGESGPLVITSTGGTYGSLLALTTSGGPGAGR